MVDFNISIFLLLIIVDFILLLIFRFLLLPLPLLPGEKVGPVEEVEDGKDTGEENPGKDVNLFGSKLEVGEPGGDPVRWNSEHERHDNVLFLSPSSTLTAKIPKLRKTENSLQMKKQSVLKSVFTLVASNPG